MNEQKPDWYGRLENGPFRKNRFTRNQMNQLLTRMEKPAKRSYLRICLTAVIAACLVVSLFIFRDEIGNLVTTAPKSVQAIPTPTDIATEPHMTALKDPQTVKPQLQLHLTPENTVHLWGEPSSKLGARTDWEYWYYNWDTKIDYAFPPFTSSSIPADVLGIKEGSVGVQLIISFFKGDALRFNLYYKGIDDQVHNFQVEKDATRTDTLADPPKVEAPPPDPHQIEVIDRGGQMGGTVIAFEEKDNRLKSVTVKFDAFSQGNSPVDGPYLPLGSTEKVICVDSPELTSEAKTHLASGHRLLLFIAEFTQDGNHFKGTSSDSLTYQKGGVSYSLMTGLALSHDQ